MKRLFSVRRRRTKYVDIYAALPDGVDQWRMKWAQNFTDAFVTMFTSSRVGFLDPNLDIGRVDSQPLQNDVRMVFDPTSYSIDDESSFWLQLVPVTGGVEGTPGAPTLVVPDRLAHQSRLLVLAGTAPAAATSAGAQQLDLPLLFDLRVTNVDTGRDLLFGVESGGREFVIPKGNQYVASLGEVGAVSRVYIRSAGGTCAFTLSGTIAHHR